MTTRVPEQALVHLRRARDHADRHFSEPIDLEDLASVAALSKYHFHRLFTATYGRTPATHLAECRIERAQDLLRSTNLSVTDSPRLTSKAVASTAADRVAIPA